MRSLNLTFEDDEFDFIKQVKNGATWHDFILNICREKSVQAEEEEE